MSDQIKYYSAAVLGCCLWFQFSLAQPAIAVALLAVFFTLLAVLILVWSALMLYSKLPSQPAIEIVEAPQPVQLPNIILSKPNTLPQLPAPIDLAQIDFYPSKSQILLGIKEENQLITSSVSQLCHVAIVGATGRGKTNLIRCILPQLQAIGAQVCLADPHFTSFDTESQEDWRAIEKRLFLPPAVSSEEIDSLFRMLEAELVKRLQLRRNAQPIGKPIFLAFDELPIISKNKNAMARLARILQEGRKVNILTVGATQSMLVRDIGSSSAIREQYQTTLYVGGDRRSASALLDMPERDINEDLLGKGVVLLRSAGQTTLARVPYVSNAAIENILQPITETKSEINRSFGFSTPTPKPEKAVSNEISGLKTESQTLRAAKLLESFQRGEKISDIVKQFYGVSSGPNYNKARDEVEQFIREQVLNGTTKN